MSDPEPTNSPSTTVERCGRAFLPFPLRLAGVLFRPAGFPLPDFPLPGLASTNRNCSTTTRILLRR
jgi:hypothetical protein